MTTSLEHHLADFLIDQQKLGLGAYCRKCLELWREHYGPEITDKVEVILQAHYRSKKEKRYG